MRYVITLLVVLFLAGCTEKPKSNLPDEWVQRFGDDDKSKLDFAQTKAINQHGKIINDLIKRVEVLEDANDG